MTDDNAPRRLQADLKRIQAEWGGIAQQRLDAMPDRADHEDRPFRDQEARRAARWEQAIPNRFRWVNLGQLDHRQDPSTLGLWAQAGASTNLIISGPVGTGKTFAAIAAARARHDAGEEVHFWPIVDLIDGLRDELGNPELRQKLFDRLTADADVLILDDLGTHRTTEWADERLYAILNRRWMDEKPTIATTNLSEQKFRRVMGERLMSRLMDDATLVVLDGTDRRIRPEL